MIHLTLSQICKAIRPTHIRFPDAPLYNQTFVDPILGQEKHFKPELWKGLTFAKEEPDLEDLLEGNTLPFEPAENMASLEMLQYCSLLIPDASKKFSLFGNIPEQAIITKEIDQRGVVFVSLDNRRKPPKDDSELVGTVYDHNSFSEEERRLREERDQNAERVRLAAEYGIISQAEYERERSSIYKDEELPQENRPPASLYICIPSQRNPAAKLIEAALDNGYEYIMSPFCHLPKDVARRAYQRIFWVNDIVAALQFLAGEVRNRVNPLVIAITGSSGKTTVKEILKKIFASASNINFIATKGNLNNHLGVPMTLLNLNYDHNVAIVEHGANHGGELDRITYFSRPDIALINNVQPAHTEGFGSIFGVALAKSEIFNHLPEEGVRIINKDSYTIENMFEVDDQQALVVVSAKDERVPFYIDADSISLNQDSLSFNLYIKKTEPLPINDNLEFYNFEVHDAHHGNNSSRKPSPLSRLRQTLEQKTEIINFNSDLTGMHNVYNLAMAAAVAVYAGVDPNLIAWSTRHIPQGLGRGQDVRWRNTLLIDDAYNANPGSIQASLDRFALIHRNGKYFVLGKLAEVADNDLCDFYSNLYYNYIFPIDLAKRRQAGEVKIPEEIIKEIPNFMVLFHGKYVELSAKRTLEAVRAENPDAKVLKLKPCTTANYKFKAYLPEAVAVILPPYQVEELYPVIERIVDHIFTRALSRSATKGPLNPDELNFAICFKGSHSANMGQLINYFNQVLSKNLRDYAEESYNGLEFALETARLEAQVNLESDS